MAEIVISLRHAYQQEETDLEVASDQPIRECIELFAFLHGWITPGLPNASAYTIEAAPGRYLPLDLTFRQANVWNGTALIFHPPGNVPKGNNQQPPKPPKQPSEPNGYQFERLD